MTGILLEFFSLRLIQPDPLAVRLVLASQSLLLVGFCPVVCESLYLFICLSVLGSSSLPCDLTSLVDLTRTVDFSVCEAFYLLLGLNGDF